MLMLKREISERLYSWKNENKKKALCVIGARQICLDYKFKRYLINQKTIVKIYDCFLTFLNA